ncbi:MAG: enolase C-terminal domain-like protein [Bryobacteraceae bacterium]
MRRRHFFPTLAAPWAVPALQAQPTARGRVKITAVDVLRLEGRVDYTAGINSQHQVNPLHIYEDHRPKVYRDSPAPKQGTRNVSSLYLRIQTDAGLEGLYGPIDNEAAVVVTRQLRSFLIGKDGLAGETLWDQMHRSNRHSRRGHFMIGISAVDNALWDLRGRYFNAPVYRLLGGPTRREVEAYGSCLGFALEPVNTLRARAAEIKQRGFRYQKWFPAYGPGDGAEGLRKNIELVRDLRIAVGEDVELMFDAFSGWDLTYAVAWAKEVERYRPRWIEEAFHPEKIESFVALRKATSVPVASGEHFYGRWETHDYLRAGAITVVQADPEWCGGVSELVKICTLSSLYDAQVIPHGHGLHASLHVVASQSPMTCPLVEYLINKMEGYYHHFEKHPLRAVGGKIALPDRPGFGIELDPAKIEKQAPFGAT